MLTLLAQHIFPAPFLGEGGGAANPISPPCLGIEELPEMPRLRCLGKLCQALPLEPREFPGWWGGDAVDSGPVMTGPSDLGLAWPLANARQHRGKESASNVGEQRMWV